MDELKIKLSNDLKKAMKDKDVIAVKTIRFLMSAIDNAGAVAIDGTKPMPMSGGIAGATSGLGSTEIPRKELSSEDIKLIVQNEIDEAEKALELLINSSRPEKGLLAEQIAILRKYL